MLPEFRRYILPTLSSLKLMATDDDSAHIPNLTLFAPLTTLELTNFTVNLEVFEHILNLSVQCIAPGLDDDIYVTQLLALAGRSPDLNVFHVNQLYILGYDRPPTMVAVELPDLRVLHLKNLLPGITTSFLAHFYIPSSAPLVAVGHRESAYLAIDFDQYRISIEADPDYPTLDICEHSAGEPGEDIISMIPVLTTSINLAPIHDFRAICSDSSKARQIEMPLGHWKIIFQALPSLTSLMLTLPTSWMRVAFQALHPNESAAGPILCPELTRLHLKTNTVDPAGARALDGVVVECLKARSRCGVGPLEMLVMNFGEDSAVDELKAIVTQVDRQ